MYLCIYYTIYIYHCIIEGSLEVNFYPTIWTDEKTEQGRGREKRKIRREITEERKESGEEVREKRRWQMREKVGKSRNTVFFQWFEAPEGRKVGSLKRRLRSQLARWEMKTCTPLWREADFEVKMHKTHHGSGRRSFFIFFFFLFFFFIFIFGSGDVEKVHAVVARSTFWSQNVQNTPRSDHFWKLRCRKSARRCGAKHISKSKCTKHTSSGPLLEVAIDRNVEKVHAVVARSTFRSQNVKNTRGSDHFWGFGCRKSARRCALISILFMWREAHFEVKMFKTLGVRTTFGGSDVASLQYTTLQDITLHCTPVHLHYTTLRSSTLRYTKLHYTTLHYTEWHCSTDRQGDS